MKNKPKNVYAKHNHWIDLEKYRYLYIRISLIYMYCGCSVFIRDVVVLLYGICGASTAHSVTDHLVNTVHIGQNQKG